MTGFFVSAVNNPEASPYESRLYKQLCLIGRNPVQISEKTQKSILFVGDLNK